MTQDLSQRISDALHDEAQETAETQRKLEHALDRLVRLCKDLDEVAYTEKMDTVLEGIRETLQEIRDNAPF